VTSTGVGGRLGRLLRSTTLRLALLYVVLFAASVGAVLGFIHYATAGYLTRQTDEAIANEVAELGNRYRQGGIQALARVISTNATTNIGQRSVYLLADGALAPIAGNLSRWPDSVDAEGKGQVEFELPTGSGEADPIRARVFRLGPRNQFHLLVGRNIDDQRALQKVIGTAMIWGIALAVGLGVVGGVVMSRSIARRLERINRTAREVMAGDLDRRVPTRGADDEFDRLAQSLNAMLDQIQYLMESVRQVSDNIAHDLRTPLTRMRWRLERLAAGDDPEGDLLERAIDDADGLLNTFHALLRIAEVESGRRRRFVELELADLIADVGELYEPVAASHEQTLNVTQASASVTVCGDRDLLFQALTNLVDNAVKYTPAGGRIDISASPNGEECELVVADTGTGIPASQRDDVLQRFVRLERSRASHGSGLGLSLVAAVARLHNASIDLEGNDPGLRARIVIPMAGEAVRR
jgi:signal transduction histidine kinase